jgi:23S rRNA U2552 (ribose-2'-O)-methylase RlmE/FtsJ
MNLPHGITCNIDKLYIKTDSIILYNKDLHTELRLQKEKIDDTEDSWDKMKKLANPYELVHSSNLKEKREKSIALYNPLSRSFFKLTEIIYKYSLLEDKINKPINMVGIAEGPGGFLEAFYVYRKNSKFKDKILGITLYPNNKFIPGWNKLNERFKNINTLYGDIYSKEINRSLSLKYKNDKCYFVTADGGFDYSVDFNNQELNSSKIIFAEIILCFKIQQKGGVFIIKFFDFFNSITIKLLYLIYMHYNVVDIFKPLTSRPANSEKYIVARGFKGVDNKLMIELENVLYKWKDNKEHYDIMGFNIHNDFYKFIDKYNIEFVNNQIKYIKKTLNLIDITLSKEYYKNIIYKQVENALNWIKNHNMKINKKSKYYIKFNYRQLTSD